MILPSHAQSLGDTAVVVSTVARPPAALAQAIRRALPPGAVDVVPAIDTVTVFLDHAHVADHDECIASVNRLVANMPRDAGPNVGTLHEIPVVYGGDAGPDFDEVCALHQLDRTRLIELHTAPDYVVEAIGFTPGFPYLSGLPPQLATPRRSTPRPLVPAGSVGIGGGQTGIYSCSTPGGWNIVGRTPICLFNPDRDPPSLLSAGDRVRFVECAATATDDFAREPFPMPAAGLTGGPAVVVGRPGLTTTIQDLGRSGHRAAGVPLSGAADPLSLRIANLIVGNHETAAGLECTLIGPDLTFECDAVVALCGADFPGFPRFRPIEVAAGETISLGHARHGCRGYLAIAGGIRSHPQLGSRSTYAPARLGGLNGMPLHTGDRLPIGPAASILQHDWSISPDLARLPQASADGCTLRFISRPAEGSGASLAGTRWRTSSRSDRMGVRFEGSPLAGGRADLPSAAVVPGTVQLPPDGRPIILLADAQTVGGYSVAGHVIAADLRLAAQLQPGDPVTFVAVPMAEARAAWRAQEDGVAALRRSLAGRIRLHDGGGPA